jgi:hypothetical protein
VLFPDGSSLSPFDLVRLLDCHRAILVEQKRETAILVGSPSSDDDHPDDAETGVPPDTDRLAAVEEESPQDALLCWEWDPDFSSLKKRHLLNAATQWIQLAESLLA